MTDKLRVAIIGVSWGGAVHVPAFRAVPPFEVVALCGSRPDHAAEVAARSGVPEATTDWQRLVQRDDVDVVAIATPVNLHYPMTMAAIRARKHVLCEKPLALNADEGRAMAEAAEDAGVANAIGFEQRWLPERIAVRELVRGGFVGSPQFVQITNNGGMWHPAQPLAAPWKFSLAAGGGYMSAVACHEIDHVCSLFGEPVAVSAEVRTHVPRRRGPEGGEFTADADDTCAILMRMDSGASAIVTGTGVSVQGTGYHFQACGSAGTIAYAAGADGPAGYTISVPDGRRDLVPSTREPRAIEMPAGAGIMARQARATALMLEDWLPALSGGATPVPTLRDGHRVQRVMDAARASSDGAGWVELR